MSIPCPWAESIKPLVCVDRTPHLGRVACVVLSKDGVDMFPLPSQGVNDPIYLAQFIAAVYNTQKMHQGHHVVQVEAYVVANTPTLHLFHGGDGGDHIATTHLTAKEERDGHALF